MKWLKNKKGITLIELMIALSLMSVVLMISYNFLSIGLSSYSKQTDDVDNQTIARQAIREITREIRKAGTADAIVIVEGKSIKVDNVLYSFEEDTSNLLKGGDVFITGIQSFNPIKEEDKIILEITTLAKTGQEITLSSSIYLRE